MLEFVFNKTITEFILVDNGLMNMKIMLQYLIIESQLIMQDLLVGKMLILTKTLMYLVIFG